MRIGKGARLYILSKHYVSERGKYGDEFWSLLGKDKDHDRRISFIIRGLVWRVWPFCYYSSAHYTRDTRSHDITPLYLPVSNIFNVTLQAI